MCPKCAADLEWLWEAETAGRSNHYLILRVGAV